MSTMQERLFEIAVNSVISNAINIGNRLNLFKTLATFKTPILPKVLAEASGCKERYIREWCNCLACGKILEVTEDEKFYIAPENIAALTSDDYPIISHGMMITLLEPFEDLLTCFKKDGPHGLDYSKFGKFQDFMGNLSKSLHEKHLFTDFIDSLGDGIREKLETGIKVLDVGCGNGFHSSLLAERYPKSKFTGLDIGEDAITSAKSRKRTDGRDFENLDFVQCNASFMPENWTETFDLVLIFDACHDQMRPDLCIQEIHRCLKPTGLFAMIEMLGTSNIYEDREMLGLPATLIYGASLFHCLPVGSNSPDALCYGAMWGKRRAVELIKSCGFGKVDTVDTPYFPLNVLYLSRKN
ncbi:unnamed protein product [Caenorhabditis angaria]|uniref:Methyltransferase domain-containing protein n=1 Tax=Caenorhabditis angaria TaxID=860376 RepID=A0A9P1N9P1_9PELO|nr:unnamed protein product [Caenorhabditis angaria]